MPEYFTPEERIHYLKQYGSHCMAYSTLQPGMRYFDMPGVGYVAYAQFRPLRGIGSQRNLVISEPIASKDAYSLIIREFLRATPSATFLQIGQDVAKILCQEHGLSVNEMGVETDISLPEFHTIGKDKSQLRHWLNKAQKEGVVVCEAEIESMSRSDVEELSNDWLSRKGGEEAKLLTRPLIPSSEPDVRYFWAQHNGRLIGLITFDPMYSGGKIISYYHNAIRLRADAPHGTSDLITVQAIKKFTEEGVPAVSLGMSPLYGIDDQDLKHSRVLRSIFVFMYAYCNYMYPFQGIHFHKEKYRGKERKVYVSSTRGNKLREMFLTLGGLNLPIFPSFRYIFRKMGKTGRT